MNEEKRIHHYELVAPAFVLTNNLISTKVFLKAPNKKAIEEAGAEGGPEGALEGAAPEMAPEDVGKMVEASLKKKASIRSLKAVLARAIK